MSAQAEPWFAEQTWRGDRLAHVPGNLRPGNSHHNGAHLPSTPQFPSPPQFPNNSETAEFPFVSPLGTPAGEVIGDFIERCLVDERNVASTLGAQAIRVVTSSGAITVVLIGFVVLTVQSGAIPFSFLAGMLLTAGIATFLVAATLAVASASPGRVVVDPASVERNLSDQWWSAQAGVARRTVARSQLNVWSVLRLQNQRKARWLRTATVIHLIGLVLVSVAALVAVTN